MGSRVPSSDMTLFQELAEQASSIQQAITGLDVARIQERATVLEQQLKDAARKKEVATQTSETQSTVEWIRSFWVGSSSESTSQPSVVNEEKAREELEDLNRELEYARRWQEQLAEVDEREAKLLEKVFKRSDGPGDGLERSLGMDVARTTRDLRDAKRAVESYTTCLSHLSEVLNTGNMIFSALNDERGLAYHHETLRGITALAKQQLGIRQQRGNYSPYGSVRCTCGIDSLLARAVVALEGLCAESDPTNTHASEAEITGGTGGDEGGEDGGNSEARLMELRGRIEDVHEEARQKHTGIQDHLCAHLIPAIKGAEALLAENKRRLLEHRRMLMNVALRNDGWCLDVASTFATAHLRRDRSGSFEASSLGVSPTYSSVPAPGSITAIGAQILAARQSGLQPTPISRQGSITGMGARLLGGDARTSVSRSLSGTGLSEMVRNSSFGSLQGIEPFGGRRASGHPGSGHVSYPTPPITPPTTQDQLMDVLSRLSVGSEKEGLTFKK